MRTCTLDERILPQPEEVLVRCNPRSDLNQNLKKWSRICSKLQKQTCVSRTLSRSWGVLHNVNIRYGNKHCPESWTKDTFCCLERCTNNSRFLCIFKERYCASAYRGALTLSQLGATTAVLTQRLDLTDVWSLLRLWYRRTFPYTWSQRRALG